MSKRASCRAGKSQISPLQFNLTLTNSSGFTNLANRTRSLNRASRAGQTDALYECSRWVVGYTPYTSTELTRVPKNVSRDDSLEA